MDCDKARDMMIDDLGKIFNDEAMRELNNHMADCESCRQEFEAFSNTWENLGANEDIEPSTGFINRLDEKIEQKSSNPFFTLYPAKTALATVLLVFAVALFTSNGNKEMKPIETAMFEYDLEMIENIELLMIIEDMDEIDLIENI